MVYIVGYMMLWTGVILLLTLPSLFQGFSPDRAFPLWADMALHAALFLGFCIFAYGKYDRDISAPLWSYMAPVCAAGLLFTRTTIVIDYHVKLWLLRRKRAAAPVDDLAIPVSYYTPDMPPAAYQVEEAPKPRANRISVLTVLGIPASYSILLGSQFFTPDGLAFMVVMTLATASGERLGNWQLRRQLAAGRLDQPFEARS